MPYWAPWCLCSDCYKYWPVCSGPNRCAHFSIYRPFVVPRLTRKASLQCPIVAVPTAHIVVAAFVSAGAQAAACMGAVASQQWSAPDHHHCGKYMTTYVSMVSHSTNCWMLGIILVV